MLLLVRSYRCPAARAREDRPVFPAFASRNVCRITHRTTRLLPFTCTGMQLGRGSARWPTFMAESQK